ncbi:hypothetical protein BD410DRAFT_854748 [Rickenella mellea]|uniref:CxC2-like cysteine cluster KDZ transposase-associated domain-containing protein n=1 Tax=Rickenella mellea TaxID=50990 RepID=A0A4Y7PJ36_9AGAM|nr:hypothetical protein BD410DRAFT_854748 [Rickenella mellea]
MCCVLAAVLNLNFGVSRANVNLVLHALRLIVNVTIKLVMMSVRTLNIGTNLQSPVFKLPKDIQTVYSFLQINPVIHRTVCCPTCFKLYPMDISQIPEECSFRKSSRAKACQTKLFQPSKIRKGTMFIRRTPRCYFATQDLQFWLQTFLQRPGIEDALHMTHDTPPKEDIYRSPAWNKAQRHFLGMTSPYNLIFGIYIDWFNPRGNKIAGAQVSCGIIALYCLNLPAHLRYQLENIYIFGLIPPPRLPDIFGTTHIMASLIASIRHLWPTPITVLSSRHPAGVSVIIYVLALIADLQAIRKVGGYLQPSFSNYLCSFCPCHRENIDDLDKNWSLRSPAEVRIQALKWKACTTLKAQEQLASTTGVRWTPFHDLEYWDPVMNVVLGTMHNWLEGVLEEHLRTYWGVGRNVQLQKILDEQENEERLLEEWTESDASESADELDDLLKDAQDTDRDEDDVMDYDYEMDLTCPPASATPSELDDDFDPMSDHDVLDVLDDSDLNYLNIDETTYKITAEELESIRSCIKEVILPTHVKRLPANLGEASHGTLKAAQYATLFSLILPLVIPEIWNNRDILHNHLFANFCHLVGCTNIVLAYSVSEEEANYFDHLYLKYRQTSQVLFPAFKSKPNHHFARHYPVLFKFWGALAPLSEFPGERLNGIMQKISTNGKNRDIGETMLRHICRRSQLKILMEKEQKDRLEMSEFLQLFYNRKAPSSSTSFKEEKYRDDNHYTKLLEYLCRSTGLNWRPFNMFPHPLQPCILQPDCEYMSQVASLTDKDIFFSCKSSHYGNSSVLYQCHNQEQTGNIDCIIHAKLSYGEDVKHTTFFLIERHREILPQEWQHNPYSAHPELRTTVVAAEKWGQIDVVEAQHIISHVIIRLRPKGTFGINSNILLVCKALDRKQHRTR